MKLLTVSQTITDPTELDGSQFETQLELIQLAGPDFRIVQTVSELGEGIRLLRLSANQPIKVRSNALTLRYVATIFDNAHEGHFAGASIEQGRMLIMPPAFDFDGCIKDGPFSCNSIFVPPEQLEAHYEILLGEPVSPFGTLKIVQPDASQLEWLMAWQSLVAADELSTFSEPQRTRLQDLLKDSALNLLTHALQTSGRRAASDDEANGKKARLAKARDLVRFAEDFANRHADINLRMIDLCRATEVSERTLQYAFQTCLGISPMNYLKRHRLHQVRQELKISDPENTTVSAIASQFGFFHFGDFSQIYKSQFGELPSQTLKQG